MKKFLLYTLTFILITFASSKRVLSNNEISSCLPTPDIEESIVSMQNSACAISEAEDMKNSCAYREAKKQDQSLRDKLTAQLSQCDGSAIDVGVQNCSSVFQTFSSLSPDGKAKLKQKLVEQMLEYDYKYHCNGNVKLKLMGYYEVSPYFETAEPNPFPARDLFKKSLDYKSSVEHSMTELQSMKLTGGKYTNPDGIVDRMSICAEPFTSEDAQSEFKILYPDCGANLTAYYRENEWNYDPSKLSQDADLQKCISNRKKQGAEIDTIQIESSSNSKPNTDGNPETRDDDAKTNFCRHGFVALSEARAKDVQKNLLPNILPDEYQAKISEAKIDPYGQNGDGTSGPCAEQLVNGKLVLKPEYASKNSLDGNMYVRVNIKFKPAESRDIQAKTYKFYSKMHCNRIGYACSN